MPRADDLGSRHQISRRWPRSSRGFHEADTSVTVAELSHGRVDAFLVVLLVARNGRRRNFDAMANPITPSPTATAPAGHRQ
jgi:hypothetical protein